MNDLHAGDRALNDVLKRLPGLYAVPRRKCEEILGEFLKPKLKALQPRKNEKASDYKMRVMGAFSGMKWRLARRKIASAFTDADMKATELINETLEWALVDGMNESAFALALNGVKMWPITLSIVSSLVAESIIRLNKRRLKRTKDAAYNEDRTQSAIHSAIMRGIKPDELHEEASKTIANTRQNETISSARAMIYGASDYGAYLAGIEAEQMGIDVEKTWLAIMDMRVRPSHKHLHGETIPLNEKFHGYHGVLRFPHDPEAPPAEIYRCRCRMAVHVAGKSPGEYSRTILPSQTSAYRAWRAARIREAGGELELLKLHKKLVK